MMAVPLLLKRIASPTLLSQQCRWQARAKVHQTSRQLRYKSQVRDSNAHNAKSATILEAMPADAWDCHMHVTSPDYPLAANAAYKPTLHDIGHAMSFEKTVRIPNIVLVQPSIYGTDNSCLLDALKAVGPRHGRGVVEIDPDTIDQTTLSEWHEIGVRGVRLNLKSTNVKFTESSLKDMLERYAKIIKPLNWVVELFIGMENIPMLERVSSGLGVRLCIAHFGAPRLPPMDKRAQHFDPYNLAGFQSLINMLERGDTWIKFSAAYRFDEDDEMRGIEAIAHELLHKAGSRIVFATDWPHTRFGGLDIGPFIEKCLQWTGERKLTEKIFVSNAKDLWNVTE